MRGTAAADGGPSRPATKARGDCHVLLAIDREAHGTADDTGPGLVGPKLSAGALIIGFEFAFRCPGEDEPAAGAEHAAHERRGRFHGPFLFTRRRVECDQLAVSLVP